jgi:hypothetical protein
VAAFQRSLTPPGQPLESADRDLLGAIANPAAGKNQQSIAEAGAEAGQQKLYPERARELLADRREVVQLAEDRIELSLREMDLWDRGGETVRALQALAAQYSIRERFERLDYRIWPSQLQLLKYLSGMPDRMTHIDLVRKQFYEPAAQRVPDTYSAYSFDDYLAFLRSFDVLVAVNNSKLGAVAAVTGTGMEYLVWRTRQGRPDKIGPL